jgi:hypothetical protein
VTRIAAINSLIIEFEGGNEFHGWYFILCVIYYSGVSHFGVPDSRAQPIKNGRFLPPRAFVKRTRSRDGPWLEIRFLAPLDGALLEPLSDYISAQSISLMNLISNHSWYLPPFLRTSAILANFRHSCASAILANFRHSCELLLCCELLPFPANFHYSYEYYHTSNPSITLIYVAILNYGSYDLVGVTIRY